MLRVLPLSSEAVGESVVNEKIFKKTHFCEHFCLSRSTNQSVAEDGYSCDRTQISSHSKSYFVSHQELGCAVLGKKKKTSISAYLSTIRYYYQVATKEYTAICFFVTIASNFGLRY